MLLVVGWLVAGQITAALRMSASPDVVPVESLRAAPAGTSSPDYPAVWSVVLPSDDPLLVALTLWSGTHGVATVLQLGFGLPPELEDAMIDEVTDRLLAGYRP